MRFRDIEGDHIFVLWRCPKNKDSYDNDDWQCKIIEYVKDPNGKHIFHWKRKSGIYDKYIKSDFEAEDHPPFFGCTMFLEDRKISLNEILLQAQIQGLFPLYYLEQSKRDIDTDYYLFIENQLGSREFRKMKSLLK